MTDVTLIEGDLTEQHRAIHRAGGPVILADCVARFPDGLATRNAG